MYFLLAILKCLAGVVIAAGVVALVLLLLVGITYIAVYGLEKFGVVMSNPLLRVYYGIVDRLPKRNSGIDK